MPQSGDEVLRGMRERIWELEEEVRQLRAAKRPEVQWPVALRLTSQEGLVLMQLYKSFPRMLTKSYLSATFFPESESRYMLSTLKSKINAKLRPWGAEVKNSWGLGLYLEHGSWVVLRDLLHSGEAPPNELPQDKKGASL